MKTEIVKMDQNISGSKNCRNGEISGSRNCRNGRQILYRSKGQKPKGKKVKKENRSKGLNSRPIYHTLLTL